MNNGSPLATSLAGAGFAAVLLILCRKGNAEAALHRLREIMGKLKLTVNEDKTQICTVPEGEFDFLGFTVPLETRRGPPGEPDDAHSRASAGQQAEGDLRAQRQGPGGPSSLLTLCWRTESRANSSLEA